MLDNSDLDGAKQVVVRSVEQFNKNLATLYTFNGAPIHSPELQARELARLVQPVETSVEKAVQVADRVAAEVESQRLQPYADPTAALSRDDLADANLRAVWVREDCESLSLDDLGERLRAVHASGSKSSTWLHWRYAKVRLDRELAKQQQDPALSAYAATCRDLGVVGDKAGLSDEAVKRQEAAQSLKRWATWELGRARDPEADARDKAKFARELHAML